MKKTLFVPGGIGDLLARTVLGLIFMYTGTLKMVSPQDFGDSIAAYQILPDSVINLVALGLPPFEIACGLMVLTGYHLRVGSFGILLMLAVFMLALVSALIRGLSIDCGCFGADSWFESNSWIALSRDLLLLLFAIFAYTNALRRVSSTTSIGVPRRPKCA